jgi:hypothetical protein
MPHSAESMLILWIMPYLKCFCIAMGQAKSPTTVFFIDCYFKGFCKGKKQIFVSTPRYAKNLRAKLHIVVLKKKGF